MSREPADGIDELRDAVRRLLRERSPLSSAHAAYDAGAGLDRDLWRRLGELGLTGMAVPEQLGGAGAGQGLWPGRGPSPLGCRRGPPG